MSSILGIDLGTSTSEIAVIKDGKPLVIPNRTGELITPSVVGISEDGAIITGEEARAQLLLKPDDTVIEVKRLMGTGKTVFMAGKEYSPPQISAYLLAELMNNARRYLDDEEIDHAVITVPANFSDKQRRATVEAGKLAGIKVDRIINEPTAAALDYGIEHMQECRNILVYDLGGGTLDVTVLELFEGVLDVKACSGNNSLGGKDFDQKLIAYILERFNTFHGIDISDDKRAMMRLREAAEKCKMELSGQEEYHIQIPLFADVGGKPVPLEETISRETFEGLIAGMIDDTSKHIDLALADSKLEASDIELVLLVGGSTRIPYVQRFIEKIMGQKPQSLIDPDLSVVRGAAIQAGLMSGEFSGDREIVITDVCPYTLGTAIIGNVGGLPVPDVYDVLIPRNVTIPVMKEKTYCTFYKDQTEVEINVYQGEYKKASYNNFLGKFYLKGIPPAPATDEKILVSFAYDVNGILQVEGKIISLNRKANLVIETTGEDMEMETDLSGWQKAPGARKYKALIKKATRMVEEGKAGFLAPEIDSLIRKIQAGLVQKEEKERLDMYRKELHDIIYELTEEANV